MKDYKQKFEFSKLSKNTLLILGILWFILFAIIYLLGEKNIFIFIISLLGLLCILYSIYLNYKISKVNEFKVNNNKIYIHTLSYGIKKEYNLNFEDIKDYQLLAEMNGWTLYIKTEQKIIKLQGIPYNNNEQCINILLKINEQSKK